MSALDDWAGGQPCERHDLPYCGGCRELAGIKRSADGTLGWQSDCAVQLFADLTQVSYDDAVDTLRAVGFRPKHGTPIDGVRTALTAAGQHVTEIRLHYITATQLSHTGRRFFVVGWKGKACHTWPLIAGRAPRALQPPFRYRIFEVTAQEPEGASSDD
jgi:hypothetical protein